ncbi:hypothetical protein ACRRTK_006547 [Alexandromys fortis]
MAYEVESKQKRKTLVFIQGPVHWSSESAGKRKIWVVRPKNDVSRVPEKAWKIVKCGCRTSFTLRLVSFSSLLKLPMDDKAYNTLLLMQVYARMSEVLGITDDNHVLETFMTKILSDFRCRTTFYTALTRLLMVDLGEDEDEFENFMLPLTVSFETVLQIFNNSFKQEEVKRMLIGLARDLRGIAFALNTKTSYTMLFDWMYPYYTVTIPALRTEGCQAPLFRLIVWHSSMKPAEYVLMTLVGQHNQEVYFKAKVIGIVCETS